MTDFLQLPNVVTTSVDDQGDRYIVEAQSAAPVAATCKLSCSVRKNGTKLREINDTPMHGKPILVRYTVQRFACPDCVDDTGKVVGSGGIYERLPFLQEKTWMTRRLMVHMAKQSMRRNFAEVSRECFVDPKTASKAFNTYVGEKIAALKRETPRVLGIDEKSLGKIYRAVLGNIEAKTVLDMLPDRDASLEEYLTNLPNKHKVEVVVTDSYDPYRTMIAECMPGRLHVTDRYHVVAKASLALDLIRASVAKRLTDRRAGASLRMARNLFHTRWVATTDEQKAAINKWSHDVPVVGDAYWTKERYCDLYLCSSPAEAEAYYKNWRQTLPSSVRDVFLQRCRIQPRWMPMVLAYFEEPYTTGYVESLNRFLDDLQRDGRGYSFEVMRAKLMLAEKLEKKTFRGKRLKPEHYGRTLTPRHVRFYDWDEMHRHGVDLRKLHRLLSPSPVTRTVPAGRLSTLEPEFDEVG